MKTLLCSLLLVSVTSGFCQPGQLANDPKFGRTVATTIRFPSRAQQLGQSIRVYVGFTVTMQGGYSDVSIVNKGPIAELLREEVKRVWAQLPSLDTRYAGRYVMPVAFLLGEGAPNHLKEIANKDDTIVQAGKYQLLNEIAVVGFLACENRGVTGVSNNGTYILPCDISESIRSYLSSRYTG